MNSLRRFFCLFLLCVVVLVVENNAQADSYQTLRQEYQRLTTSAQLQRQRANWEQLIARFDGFIARESQSSYLDNAHFLRARTQDGLARASGSTSDARRAIDLYVETAERFIKSRFADDALYHAGRLAEDRLQDPTRAVRYYRRVVIDTPGGDMVSEAQKRLAVLPAAAVVETPSSQYAPQVTTASKPEQHQLTASSPTLTAVRFWSGPEYTRIVLDLTAPVIAEPHYLPGANPRLYFDLVYTEPADDLPAVVSIENGLVERVRASRFDTQRSRVVIDLVKELEYRTTTLTSPHRLVIDILGAPTAAVSSTPAATSDRNQFADDTIAGILDRSVDRQPELRVRQTSSGEGVRLIVVDAGHGGRDPGAVGPSGVKEKDVNLAMARITAEALRKQLGVKVLLSRDDDSYLDLRERTAYANRVGADLFISLHANASNSRRAYGVETYFLNLSKTDDAAAVAARENGMTVEEVSNLEAILFDLMANAKINESSRLAAEIQQSMIRELSPRYSDIQDKGVKQGPFHVLLGANMPSALVEAAFISHAREEKRLNSSDYQRRVADAIVRAVKNYAIAMGQVTWN